MKMLRNLSITLKLTLVFILFATLLLLGLSVPAYLNARYSLRSAAVSELLATSLEKEAALNAWVENRQHNMLDIASQPQLQEILQDYLNLSAASPAARLLTEEINRNLQNWTGQGHLFQFLQILEADSGRIILSTNPADVGKFREQEAFFIKGRDGSVIENPIYDLSSGSYVMMGAAPIVAADGSLLAVLAGSLDLTEMGIIIQRRTGLHQMDDAFLVNTSHLFVTLPRLQTNATVVQHGIDTVAVDTCLERNSGVYEGDDYRGIPAIVVYRWMGERNMCLIVKIDQQEAYRAAQALRRSFLLVSVLVLLAGSLASLAISRTVTRPLHDLLGGTIQLGQGNLEERIQVRSSDEFGKLGQAFNQMAGSLQAQEIQLRGWAGELEQKVEQRTLELSDSEERYRILAETSPDMIFVINQDDQVQYVNDLAAMQFGKTPEEVIGKARTELFPPALAESQGYALKQVFNSGEPLVSESPITFPDGQRWLDTQLVPLRNKTGQVNAVMGVSRDVTERKQAEIHRQRVEDDLRASEERYRNILETIEDGYFEIDLKGTFTFFNPALPKIYRYDPQELMGMNYRQYIDPKNLDIVFQSFNQVYRTGLPAHGIEWEVTCKDGEKLFIEGSASLIKNSEGSSTGFRGIVRDVTLRKQAEEDLYRSESELRALFAAMPDLVLMLDKEGRYLKITETNQDLLYKPMEELIGKTLHDVFPTNEADQFIGYILEVLNSKKTIRFEYSLMIRDKEKWFATTVTPMTEDAVIWVARDVTESKQASVLLLDSEAKYRSLFDNVPVGVYRSSPDGSILAANKALVSMLGYDSEIELIRTNASQVYASQDERNKYLEEIDRYGVVKNLEIHLRTRQGQPIVGLEYARSFHDENGRVLYYEGSLTDITGRKQVDLERQILLEIMQGLTVTDDLHDYLEIVHHAIGKVIKAKNFFVALNSKTTGVFNLAYLVDEFDQQVSSYEMGKTLSAYVYRNSKPYLFNPQSFDDLRQQGLVEMVGAYSPSWLGVPLIVSNETIGVMVVQDYETENQYSQHDVDILTSISGGVAQAIRRKSAETELAQLFDAEQRRSQRLSDLQILSAELTSLHTEQELLENLVNKAALLSNSPVCTVMLLDPNTQEIVLAAHFGLPAGVPPGLRIPIALLPEAARVFQSGNTILISNIDQEMPALRKVLVHPGVHSFFAFPLLIDGVVSGAITLSSLQPRHPSEAEIKTYELLARLTSAALDNVRLFENINRSLQRMESLRRVDMAISASFDLVMTLNVLLEQVTTHLGVDAADILVLDATDSTLKYTSGRGFHSQALKHTNLRIGEGFAGQAALERRTIHVPDLKKEMHGLEKSSSLPSEGFTTYWGVPLLAKGHIQGVLEVFNRQPIQIDEDWVNFLETLAGQAAIAVDNVQLFNHLERSNSDLAMAYDSTLTGWATALELRDNETEGHTRRVALTTIQLAVRMGTVDEDIRFIRWGALLHDIGKMGIPDSILLKPGPLSDEEWVTMRTHPVLAYNMLSPIHYLNTSLDIPYCHHEKWDGSGYPRGLKGDQIPLSARIFAIVDVWDALTSDRPYRSAWTPKKTMKYIQEQAGTHFDPQVVKAFMNMIGPDGILQGL